jgi:hypothetical protein
LTRAATWGKILSTTAKRNWQGISPVKPQITSQTINKPLDHSVIFSIQKSTEENLYNFLPTTEVT